MANLWRGATREGPAGLGLLRARAGTKVPKANPITAVRSRV